ncbi:MAG TPA: hypothetical protein VIX12_07535 [Candidatus Binataceae bacterium]
MAVLPPPGSRFRVLLIACAVLAQSIGPSAHAWDSSTHRMITKLAIEALPPTALKDFMLSNTNQLAQYSVEPDSVLKARYGKSEEIRHYIDLERFGADPFAALNPDWNVMRQSYGDALLRRSGTLPWTIEDFAARANHDWSQHACPDVVRDSGLLSHYIGDASQPLHTTMHWDGYRQDRGIHARIEGAADRNIAALAALARPEIQIVKIDSVWPVVISEIRESESLIGAAIKADRDAVANSTRQGYQGALMLSSEKMLAGQIARAASVLGSVWQFEWNQAGQPAGCNPQLSLP